MAAAFDYEPDKLRELVLYVAGRSRNDPRFGLTKLNKILFFSDFGAYRRTGRPITGAVYQHLPQGPCPHQLLPVLGALKRESAVVEVLEPTYGGTQKRLVPLREADLSSFSGVEIAAVEEAITLLASLTNQQASDLSHETMAWRLTTEHQEIPYGTAILSSDEPTDEDLLWLKGVAEDGALVS